MACLYSMVERKAVDLLFQEQVCVCACVCVFGSRVEVPCCIWGLYRLACVVQIYRGGEHVHQARERTGMLDTAVHKNWESHIDASHSRQPLVKGERLVRYEVNAVIPNQRPPTSMGIYERTALLCIPAPISSVASVYANSTPITRMFPLSSCFVCGWRSAPPLPPTLPRDLSCSVCCQRAQLSQAVMQCVLII